ncbi:MAG: DUF1028 domain-containing protein [Pseudomonadota bacterium]
MTFSITARCVETGMFGVAVASSSPAVAARCAHARAGVGAVASQNVTDPSLGNQVLDLLERGATADEAIEITKRRAPYVQFRQITAVDRLGKSAIFSGSQSLGIFTETLRPNIVCAGNLLANSGITDAMADAFERSEGHLGDRLVVAMHAALEAGGEAGPVHSAGMYIHHDTLFPLVDLRCDWTQACPIEILNEAWLIYRPQMGDYVARALDPTAAPSYGVPGDT